MIAATGDIHNISDAITKGTAMHGAWYLYIMVISAATLGCVLNFSMFLCTLYNTALTTTIVGVLRGVVTILLGFAYDTVKFSALNVTGITINTLGGVWYTWIKFTEKYGSEAAHDIGGKGKSTEHKSRLEKGPDGKLLSYTKLGSHDEDREAALHHTVITARKGGGDLGTLNSQQQQADVEAGSHRL
jgi:hypothetical protein